MLRIRISDWFPRQPIAQGHDRVGNDAPGGTEIHYTKDSTMMLDRLVDGAWVEDLPRTFQHPGFGG